MTERGLAFLDEFLDTIVALPHDVQRLLTLLREKDAFAHGIEEGLGRTAAFLLKHPKLDGAAVRQNLVEMESRLAAAAGAAEEKVSIARHMHELVVHHVKRLEDEVCQFEEELRTARNFGDLDDLDEGSGPAADGEPTSGGETGGSGGPFASARPSAGPEGGAPPGRGRHAERGSGERRRGGKRRSRDEVGAPTARNPRGESPRRADSSGFDQIPTSTALGAVAADRPAKRSRRVQDQALAETAPEAPSSNNPPSARPATTAAPLGTTTDGSPSPAFSALEPTYCYCNQISFGEMIGCDNPACDIEWFHYGCVGLSAPPPGKWYCPDCAARLAKDYTKTLPSETLVVTSAAGGGDVPSLTPPASGRRSSRATTASVDN